MPYIPRNTPNLSGPQPGIYHEPAPQAEERKEQERSDLSPTLSITEWQVPTTEVYKQLFGMEPKRDDTTGELLYPRRTC